MIKKEIEEIEVKINKIQEEIEQVNMEIDAMKDDINIENLDIGKLYKMKGQLWDRNFQLRIKKINLLKKKNLLSSISIQG